MSAPVSIVVASLGRPTWLARCLTALGQLDYPAFEIVIAADVQGLAAVAAHTHAAEVKTVRCDEANLAATRNSGISLAAGAYVAFIDDDAVPEPLWLRHHMTALETTGADASVGFVRGRNGITFQSRAATIDTSGETHDLTFAGDDPATPVVPDNHALKLVGTNTVISRAALAAVGGFDPAFRFYLDDSDVSLRLGTAGCTAAVAPLAEVHHGVAPSPRRSAHRFPRRLYDIGRSTAIFLRKHGSDDPNAALPRVLVREKARLVRHMVQGTCEPRDIGPALADFRAGWADGLIEDLDSSPKEIPQNTDFKRFSVKHCGHRVLSSRLISRRKSRAAAAESVKTGHRATVFSFSPTTFRHHVRFHDDGFWEQTGGLFGPSIRTQPAWRWCRFARRVKDEIARVEKQRGIRESGVRVG